MAARQCLQMVSFRIIMEKSAQQGLMIFCQKLRLPTGHSGVGSIRDRMKDVQRQLNRRHSAQLAWSRMDGTDDRLMFLSPRGPCPAQWKEPVTGFGKPGRSNLIYLMRYWWAPRMLSCPAELRARPRHLRQLSRLQCSIRTPATLVSDLKTEDDSFTKIGFLHLSSSVGLHRRQRHKDLPRRSYVRLLKSNPILSS